MNQSSFKKTSKIKDNKFTNKQYFFYAINHIIGFGFIATISGVLNLGSFGILVFAIAAFISFVVALVFSRAAQAFPDTVGGSYAYAKKAFGRKMAFLNGWNQYMQGPLLSASAPLFLANILISFDPDNVIIYSSVSILIFVLLNIIATLGINFSKKFLFSFASIKWAIIAIAFFIVIVIAFINRSFAENIQTTRAVGAAVIFGSVVSFLFAFGGFGAITAISKDTKTQNFRKLLMFVFYIVLIFYFLFYIFFLGINTSPLINSDPFARIYIIAFGTTGLVLFTIGLFFNQSSARISATIAIGRGLSPLAADGFFPHYLSKKNSKNEYKNAIYFSATLSIISMIFLNIIPRVLNLQDSFNNILQIGTLGFLLQYILTTWTVLVLKYKKLINKIPLWELLVYYLGLIIMITVFVVVLIPPTVGAPWTLAETIKTPTFIFALSLGFVVWYFTSLDKKRAKKYHLKGFNSALNYNFQIPKYNTFKIWNLFLVILMNLLLPVLGTIIYLFIVYDKKRMHNFYLQGIENKSLDFYSES
ncbi:APC family permease [[Mycoplasma] mobile]|uniref:Amino acid permease n=1 Tax=Mycoplasma mobile (strain ATCC 43663 / 163K / NCTC 11711) TaxID=267748 RepID=Q6KI84_MYCM1|nr:APC family permease [[Mycoplasma] mobile]AAT27692.1 amino acid permease [Mycoplasma mobile 163K]